MIDRVAVIAASVPLRVRELEVQDPFVTLVGEDWSLSLRCPWHGMVAGQALSWEDDNLEDRAWDFVGEDLLSVREAPGRAVFSFSTGVITVEPDTDLDPWVLKLPSCVVVGSMT